MINFNSVSVTYDGSDRPALSNVTLRIPEGELALVVGGTGSGKSTLLNCVNGLVPHFTGGTLSGSVVVSGRDTRQYPPRELADVVGVVRQDPQSGFVTDIVEDELAYTMESLAIRPDVMRRRVEETLDIMGLAPLRGRTLRTLSGGERQRAAIGAVLTAQPDVLVLDEPTSALDPQAAEEVLAAIQRLVHDLGLTVLMSEHRLERVVQYADEVIIVDESAHATQYEDPAEAMRYSPVRPPIVDLGLALGWDPLPLSVRDARRKARTVRDQLTVPANTTDTPGTAGTSAQQERPPGTATASRPRRAGAADRLRRFRRPAASRSTSPRSTALTPTTSTSGPSSSAAREAPTDSTHADVAPTDAAPTDSTDTHAAARSANEALPGVLDRTTVSFGNRVVLRKVSLAFRAGEVTAVMGRNGAGKTTALRLLAGSLKPSSGRVRVSGTDPAGLSGAELLTRVAFVPQEPDVLLWAESVAAECRSADADAQASPGTCRSLLDQLLPDISGDMHPRDLSVGSRLMLVLAIMLTGRPHLLILDEPTRGLDYEAKSRLGRVLQERAGAGSAVVLATHDVEFVAGLCDRVVILADADVVTDDSADRAVIGSPAFAPQVAKIMAPARVLTVADVLDRIGTGP